MTIVTKKIVTFLALFLTMRMIVTAQEPRRSLPPPPMSLPNCPDSCGDQKIPYPFGTTKECALEDKFLLTCNKSKPHLDRSQIEVADITLDGNFTVFQFLAWDCYNSSGGHTSKSIPWIRLQHFTVSESSNEFMTIGCDTLGIVKGYRYEEPYSTGCVSSCSTPVLAPPCSGIGCCRVSIPKGLKNVSLDVSSFVGNNRALSFSRCSYAFVVKRGGFKFSKSSFEELNNTNVLPMVFDWSIGNVSCEQAKALGSEYKCKANSNCFDSATGSGYLCSCLPAFEGNPYHPQGCRDIDECKSSNPCVNGTCNNEKGTFGCTCLEGYTSVNSTFCEKQKPSGPSTAELVSVPLGVGTGIISVVIVGMMLYCGHRKRKLMNQKEKFFEQNGGLMLQQRLGNSQDRSADQTTKIFTEEELKRATSNYDQIHGEGGYGIVYKGVLDDERVVAIKKPKSGINTQTQQQTEQFINEVILLMQINHRNVVRLLGCCLDTEVPILVYEFITNGTLYEHLHKKGSSQGSTLTWELRLKIAAETAGALAYLHSETNTPILHRDIKSMNILLDENYNAKVADFGASRLIPLDQEELSTLVQGTIGYLDPEYLQSSQLTDKSDVYSFGVVLAELLTGKRAVSFNKSEGTTSNLAMSFLLLKEDEQIQRVVDKDIDYEANAEAVREVVNVAKWCLRIKGEERPTMKEVAMELEGLKAVSKLPWGKDYLNEQENRYLLGSPSNDNTYGYGYGIETGSRATTFVVNDSIQDQSILRPHTDGR